MSFDSDGRILNDIEMDRRISDKLSEWVYISNSHLGLKFQIANSFICATPSSTEDLYHIHIIFQVDGGGWNNTITIRSEVRLDLMSKVNSNINIDICGEPSSDEESVINQGFRSMLVGKSDQSDASMSESKVQLTAYRIMLNLISTIKSMVADVEFISSFGGKVEGKIPAQLTDAYYAVVSPDKYNITPIFRHIIDEASCLSDAGESYEKRRGVVAINRFMPIDKSESESHSIYTAKLEDNIGSEFIEVCRFAHASKASAVAYVKLMGLVISQFMPYDDSLKAEIIASLKLSRNTSNCNYGIIVRAIIILPSLSSKRRALIDRKSREIRCFIISDSHI